MPLMVFIGEKGKTRRSKEKQASRSAAAANRGYTRERIEALKNDEKWSRRGRGAPSQTWEEIPGTDWAWGRSSSSNQAANDPSRTASQDERGWNAGWNLKNNWGYQ